jgi:NAD-dependent deacetylase
MKHIVIFSGAGISAESGLATFRDSDGLWQKYDLRELASPQAWAKDRSLVLRFYNQRLKDVLAAEPNAAHQAIASLEDHFQVTVITQNIDDLHERAGSTRVIHLHGEIRKARSSLDRNLTYPMKNSGIAEGDKCEKGSQLRPHVVWFGEEILRFPEALEAVRAADIFVVVGTSLQVYPAAGLVNEAPDHADKFIITLAMDNEPLGYQWLKTRATEALPALAARWKASA